MCGAALPFPNILHFLELCSKYSTPGFAPIHLATSAVKRVKKNLPFGQPTSGQSSDFTNEGPSSHKVLEAHCSSVHNLRWYGTFWRICIQVKIFSRIIKSSFILQRSFGLLHKDPANQGRDLIYLYGTFIFEREQLLE